MLAKNLSAQRIAKLRADLRGLRAMRNLGRAVVKARTRAKLAHVRDRTKQLRASLRTAASAVAELAKYITIGAKVTLSAPQRAALEALAAEHHTYHEAWKGDLEVERTHRRGLTPARSDSHIRGARTRAEREEEADSLLAGNLEPLEARIFWRLRKRLPFKTTRTEATKGASRLEVFLEYLHNHSHEYNDQARIDEALNEAELQKAEAAHYADHGEHVPDDSTGDATEEKLDAAYVDPTDETADPGPAGAWKPTSIYEAGRHRYQTPPTIDGPWGIGGRNAQDVLAERVVGARLLDPNTSRPKARAKLSKAERAMLVAEWLRLGGLPFRGPEEGLWLGVIQERAIRLVDEHEQGIYRAREAAKRDAADRARAAREMTAAKPRAPRAPRKPRAADRARAAAVLSPTDERIAERAAYLARIEALQAAEAIDPRAIYEARMTAEARALRASLDSRPLVTYDDAAHTEGREGSAKRTH